MEWSYIPYLIDLFTRLTKAKWIKDEFPATVINKIMTMWIEDGLVTPEKSITDNGGEFDFCDLAENLNIQS